MFGLISSEMEINLMDFDFDWLFSVVGMGQVNGGESAEPENLGPEEGDPLTAAGIAPILIETES